MERRRTLAISLALAGHLIAVGALVVSGAWTIDKLAAAEPPLLSPLLPPAAAPMPAGGEEPTPAPAAKREHRARDRTQPVRAERDTSDAPDGDGEATGAAGAGAGPGGDGDGPLSVIPLACPPGTPCQALTQDVPPPAPRARRVVVPSRLVEGHRIAGDPQIQPPDVVRTHMLREGQNEARGTVEMCLDTGGRVSGLRMLLSTRHPAYDARLLERMRTWRYRPYRTSGGEAVPICTAVTFIYRVR